MFEKFTEKAIKVVMLAQEEARRLGHNFVGTEQILLGLIGEGSGLAARALKESGLNLKDTRVEVEKIIGRGSGFVGTEIPMTPRATRILELAWDDSQQLGHNYIGTEHLLLGLLRDNEGVAARVLAALKIDTSKIRPLINSYLNVTGTANQIMVSTSPAVAIKMPTMEESIREIVKDELIKLLNGCITHTDITFEL